MAMSKEQQAEAAKRILAKHPLAPEERERAEFLKQEPKDYPRPTERRVCGVCGAEFREIVREGQKVTTLEQFADHQAEHNPSPAQWTEAHNQIQEAKASRKEDT